MNQVALRKLPKFNIITDDHKEDFEWQVIELYFLNAKENEQSFGLPQLPDDLLFNGNPKYLLAGIYEYVTGDSKFYNNQVEGMDEDEEMSYIIRSTSDFFAFNETDHFLSMYHDDIETVLDYHNICFVNTILGSPFKDNIGHLVLGNYIQNPPITKVW
jgi:hypothetical protein